MKPIEIWNNIDVPLIAILRGITPDETPKVVEALLSAGFRAIEIPLNSPSPFESIGIAAEVAKKRLDKPCLIGAGTVLSLQDVNQVHEAGGNLIVSPNVNAEVIQRTRQLDMLSAPGVFTPSECLSAIEAGADILKLFPASQLSIGGVKAYRAVLPSATALCAVGGVGNDDFQHYVNAGVSGFGLGSSLYKPGLNESEISKNANATVKAYLACKD